MTLLQQQRAHEHRDKATAERLRKLRNSSEFFIRKMQERESLDNTYNSLVDALFTEGATIEQLRALVTGQKDTSCRDTKNGQKP